MRVTKQHPRIAMAAYQSNLRDAEPALEKTTDGFVTKVVEAEIRKAGTFHEDFRGRERSRRLRPHVLCAQSEGGSLAVSFGAEWALFFALMLAHQFFDFNSAFAHR